MTNFNDDYSARIKRLGIALEETERVPEDGFVDPNGEYPAREYYYATSVNKSAKGETVNRLSINGGDLNLPLELPEQKPSIFPYNQVQETPSGHAIEYDDTPGAERILLKHRTGAGVEMRADGTVVIVSQNQRIEVTGGDHKTIVEGEGTLVYKGNLTLDVTGDFNVNVGGNYNVNVGNDKVDKIQGRQTTTVDLDQNHVIRGSRNSQVVGTNTDTILGDNNVIVGNDMSTIVNNDLELLSGNNILTTAGAEWTQSSNIMSLSARQVSVFGHKGTIGGPLVDFYGKAYGGSPAGITQTASFYGTFIGRATEAIHADYAIKSSLCDLATQSVESLVTGKETGGITIKPPTPNPGVMPYVPIPATAPIPNPAIVETHLSSGSYGIRNVEVDPALADKILKSDDYDDLFNNDPSIYEIRSKLRDPANLNNDTLTGYLVSEGKLNKNFKINIPKNISRTSKIGIGRSANKNASVRFGNNLIGNNPIENRSKRFKVNKKS